MIVCISLSQQRQSCDPLLLQTHWFIDLGAVASISKSSNPLTKAPRYFLMLVSAWRRWRVLRKPADQRVSREGAPQQADTWIVSTQGYGLWCYPMTILQHPVRPLIFLVCWCQATVPKARKTPKGKYLSLSNPLNLKENKWKRTKINKDILIFGRKELGHPQK